MFMHTSTDQRLSKWKAFRDHLENLNNEEALNETAQLWAKAPLMNHYLVHDDPDTWPTPWELISENIFCDLAVSLGIFYSLGLSNKWDSSSFWLRTAPTDELNLLFVNDQVLNYETGKVINTSQLPRNTKFQYVYNYSDLKIDSYK